MEYIEVKRVALGDSAWLQDGLDGPVCWAMRTTVAVDLMARTAHWIWLDYEIQ